MSTASDPLSVNRGRLYLVLAALLWSFSGAFAKVLTQPTWLGLHEPILSPVQLACFRTLIGGMVLALAVRPRDVVFRPAMIVAAVCFAAMNVMFVTAAAHGSSANAILLQYTAPLWVVLASLWWLKEPTDRRTLQSVLLGLVGIVIIVVGGWHEAQLGMVTLSLGSGFMYACVLICLRLLRDCSPVWITVVNFLVSGLVLLPFVLPFDPAPTPTQWVTLFLFGFGQMAIPYLLMARALKTVGPAEAGIITLLELIFNPLWAYIAAGEVPTTWTFAGGACILSGLAWRYWPRRPSPMVA